MEETRGECMVEGSEGRMHTREGRGMSTPVGTQIGGSISPDRAVGPAAHGIEQRMGMHRQARTHACNTIHSWTADSHNAHTKHRLHTKSIVGTFLLHPSAYLY